MKPTRPLVLFAIVGAVVSLAAELLFIDRSSLDDPFTGSTAFLFWAGFGLAWCVAIVLVAKWAGHAFLMKHQDPYTGEPVEEGDQPLADRDEHAQQDALRGEDYG